MRIVLGFTIPRKPILGVELAGEVVSIGREVTRFKKGDQVYALTGMRFGAHAEFLSISGDSVVTLKPHNLTYRRPQPFLLPEHQPYII